MQEDKPLRLPATSPLGIDGLTPYLAGQIGQAALDRLAGSAHPELDQHIAAVRDAVIAVLGRPGEDPDGILDVLVRYASGFLDAATAGGWRPAPADQPPDWESIRLAAVCELVVRVSAEVSQEDSRSARRKAS
jgi:Family of unknown function (DUF6401)